MACVHFKMLLLNVTFKRVSFLLQRESEGQAEDVYDQVADPVETQPAEVYLHRIFFLFQYRCQNRL